MGRDVALSTRCDEILCVIGLVGSEALCLPAPYGIEHHKSRYCLIAHVPFKTAQAVSEAMIGLLKPFAACVQTLTTDNGKEFAQHERIANKLDADFFFAHPYASWERGANENMNGLIRQFFPKKMRFNSITAKDIAFAMHRLNHRPRKCLGFKTPHEVFMKHLHSRHNTVALQA
jgi:IS30 family transposase